MQIFHGQYYSGPESTDKPAAAGMMMHPVVFKEFVDPKASYIAQARSIWVFASDQPVYWLPMYPLWQPTNIASLRGCPACQGLLHTCVAHRMLQFPSLTMDTCACMPAHVMHTIALHLTMQMDAYTVADFLLGYFREHLLRRSNKLEVEEGCSEQSDACIPGLQYASLSLVQVEQYDKGGRPMPQKRYMLMVSDTHLSGQSITLRGVLDMLAPWLAPVHCPCDWLLGLAARRIWLLMYAVHAYMRIYAVYAYMCAPAS